MKGLQAGAGLVVGVARAVGAARVARAARAVALVAVTALTLAGPVAGCVRVREAAPPEVGAPPVVVADPSVINFTGLGDIRWGQTLAELRAAGVVATGPELCGPRFVTLEAASPVFDDSELVLVWAYPPLHTPENVMVGTPVVHVRTVYPAAVTLPPSPGSYPALLVANGTGEAYLILHDDAIVQKLIVGREDAARRLYASRLDTC